MKERVRVRKSGEAAADATQTNRLTNISVNEVSIVDSAANKRKFLVVKDDSGGAPPPPPPAAPPPPTAPAALTISPELKAKVSQVLQSAQEKIGAIAKALDGATETPGAPAPQQLMDALASLSGLFSPQPPAAPPAAPHAPPPHAPPAPAAKDETAKAGKKISAERLKQLMTAKTALDTILSEVATDATEEEVVDGDSKTKTEKNEASTTVAAPAPAPSEELVRINAQLDNLAGLVGKMTLVFEGQNTRIDQLAKARGESRQVDLDNSSITKAEKVVWEMDMAKPTKVVA